MDFLGKHPLSWLRSSQLRASQDLPPLLYEYGSRWEVMIILGRVWATKTDPVAPYGFKRAHSQRQRNNAPNTDTSICSAVQSQMLVADGDIGALVHHDWPETS